MKIMGGIIPWIVDKHIFIEIPHQKSISEIPVKHLIKICIIAACLIVTVEIIEQISPRIHNRIDVMKLLHSPFYPYRVNAGVRECLKIVKGRIVFQVKGEILALRGGQVLLSARLIAAATICRFAFKGRAYIAKS